jgi:probable F420-dependent oxidoreductase
MKFGVCIPNYGETVTVDGLRTVALEAERMGYDSVWTTDHILMPTQSGTPYERILESISSLAYLAPLTSTVKLGISSLIMAMRNPVVVAKQLATVDRISGGRVMLATSAGWVEKEFAYLGSNFRDRGKRLDDSIRLIRALWGGSANARFDGKNIPHEFSDVVFEPRPIQRNLTIWIAGASEAAMKRAITLGDAWHPNVYPLDTFKKLVTQFRNLSGGKNKPICARIALNTKASTSEYVNPQGEGRFMLSGNMEANKNAIAELERLGVSYILVTPSPDGKINVPDQVQSLRMISEKFIRKSGYIA